MSTNANGYFESFVNGQASNRSTADRALIAALDAAVKSVLPGTQVQWAGSRLKGTAIATSDLDTCLVSPQPITAAQRRSLAVALEAKLGRPAKILSHVIRFPPHGQSPRLDLSFTNAVFGSRLVPNVSQFKSRPARQCAARAMKLWIQGNKLPATRGWVVEALVVHGDAPAGNYLPLGLFLRILKWLETARPADVEAILRHVAHPGWNPAWSNRVTGPLQAFANQARALATRKPAPEAWTSAADVATWLVR